MCSSDLTNGKDQLPADRIIILYIMGDVLRILDRFRITGRGVVYTVKISKNHESR